MRRSAIAFGVLALFAGTCFGRLLPETFLSCQVQFYPLSETTRNYLSRWHDAPFLLNNALEKGGRRNSHWSAEEMRVSCREMRACGFDGLSFFPDTFNRLGPYDLAAEGCAEGLRLVPILQANRVGLRHLRDEVMRRVVGGFGLVHAGRQVVYAYKTRAFCGGDTNVFAANIAGLRRDYGDRFLFMADLDGLSRFRAAFDEKGFVDSDARAAKDEIRRWLRVADGIYFGEVHMLQRRDGDTRVFHAAFYRGFIIRLMREVLDEPEFRGRKLFGLAALVGHENDGQWGYYLSHDGTKTLRASFAVALEAAPDYVNFCEWDEWNENTCICPTMRSAFTTKRILRAMVAAARGRTPEPLAGDDSGIPNFILSVRSTLAYGEANRIEILNVPDGATGDVTFRLTLLNETGAVLRAFAPETLPRGELKDHTYRVASEDFAPSRVVRYRLETTCEGRTQIWEDGLPATELRVTTGGCCRWNKQPLRDLAVGARAEIRAGKPTADKLLPVSFDVAADESLAHVVLAEDDEALLAHDPTGFESSWRESSSNWVFCVNYWAVRDVVAKGCISVTNGTDAMQWRELQRVVDGPRFPVARLSRWSPDVYLRQAKDSRLGALVSDAPELADLHVPLERVVRSGAFVQTLSNGVSVAVHRSRFQSFFPARRIGARMARGEAFILPAAEEPILRGSVVTASGKTWWMKPVLLARGTETRLRRVRVRSEVARAVREIAVPASLAPTLAWDFSDSAGALVPVCGGELMRAGILGLPVALATFANRYNGCLASDPFKSAEWDPSAARGPRNPQPARRIEDGRAFLRFSGGDYLLLPQGVLPRTAAWTLSFRLRPQALGRLQTPFACRWANASRTPGSFWLSVLEDGRVRLDYGGIGEHTRVTTPLRVCPGEWNDLRVVSTVDAIELELNGVRSGARPCVAPGRHEMICTVGGCDGEWFVGDLGDLALDLGVGAWNAIPLSHHTSNKEQSE